jgi:hypothetical protein
MYLSSGGYFLIPILLDSSLVKNNEIILILGLIIFISIFERAGPTNKFEEIGLIFINNKVLTRLNIILLEIFSDESNLESENIGICLERILDLIIKFTEIKKYDNLCNNNILKSLINLCYNIPIIYIPKVLKIFDNILKEPSTINVSLFLK